MNTTAAIFFLVLGQADGSGTAGFNAGGIAVIPSHYTSHVECEAAGEAARANNVGLSFLSYTCVPASVNVAPVKADVKFATHNSAVVLKASQSRCDEVCELIEATP